MGKWCTAVFALLFLSGHVALAQWQLTPDAHAGHSYCMDARPSGKIFVGGLDTLISSNNFGASWNLAGINPHITIGFPQSDITSMAFLNDLTGFACVNVQIAEEAIIKTTDGGNTWAPVMDSLGSSVALTLNAIQFPSSQVGYAVGWGQVFQSATAGNFWQPVYRNQNYHFNAVGFANADTGYAMMPQGYLHTVNGGLTWIIDTPAIFPYISAVQFPTDTIGYAIGEYNNLLYKFSGNGLDTIYNNLAAVLPYTYDARDLFFTSHDTGYIIANNDVFKTTDGAISWAIQHISSSAGFRHIKFVNSDEGAILCDNGRVYITTNQGGVYQPLSKIITPGNGTYCQGVGYTFTAMGDARWSYKWYLNGILRSTTQSYSDSTNFSNSNTLVSIVSNGMAADTNTSYFSVNPQPTVNYFQVTRWPTDTLCPNETVQMDIGATPVQAGATYTLLHNGAYVTNVLPDNRYYQYPGGVYTIVASVADMCRRSVKDSVSINVPVHPAPSPNPDLSSQIFYLQDTICLHDSITLAIQNTSPIYTYSIYNPASYNYPGNGGTLYVRELSSDVLNASHPTYVSLYVNITSPFNCNYTVTKNDTIIIDTAIASFNTAFGDYLNTDTVYLNNTSTGAVVQWTCNPLSTLSSNTATSPYLTANGLNGPDSITLIEHNGVCRDTAAQSIYFDRKAPGLNLPECYKTAMYTPGTDNNSRAIIDQHVNRAGELLVAGYYYYAECSGLCLNFNMFISKFDTAGKLMWEKKCFPYSSPDSAVYSAESTTYYDFSAATGITTDDNDNVYVSGVFTSDRFTLDTVTVSAPTPGTQSRCGFIAKLNAAGHCEWMVATLSLPTYDATGYETNTYFSDIEYWGHGLLLAAGRDTATAGFKNGVYGFNGPIIIDTNGRFIKSYPLYDLAQNTFASNWVENNRAAGTVSVSIDEFLPYFPLIQKQGNDMYLYGFFRGLSDSVQQINSTLSGTYNAGVFAAKLSYGGWQWLRELGSGIWGASLCYKSFALDDSANIYLVQDYLDVQNGNTAYFNPGVYENIVNPVEFVSKFSPAGNLIWSKSVPAFPRPQPYSPNGYRATIGGLQIVFANQHLYLNFGYAGNFAGIESNGSVFSFHNLDYSNPSGQYPSGYYALVELDVAGNLTGYKQLGRGTVASLGPDAQICTNPCHSDVYVTGIWMNDSIYQSIPPRPQLDSAYYYAIHLSPTNNCITSTCNSAPFAPAVTVNSCTDSVIINYADYISDVDGDSVYVSNVYAHSGTIRPIPGGILYKANIGVSTDTIFYTACDLQGACDSSMFFISLTKANISVTADTLRSTASLTGYQYTWINCNTGTAVSSDSVFVPLQSGVYALVKTLTCSDTSQCLAVVLTNINEADALSVLLWPNPVLKQLNLACSESTDEISIRVLDLQGRPVYETQTSKQSVTIDTQHWQAGCYFLQITSGNKSLMQKVVKMN